MEAAQGGPAAADRLEKPANRDDGTLTRLGGGRLRFPPQAADVPPVRSLLSGLLVASLLAGCQVVEVRNQPAAVSSHVESGVPATAWEVVAPDTERIGIVVRFASTSHGPPLFMVRNVWHQDLGLIDARGRAYRYVPHHADPAWVGTGTVLQGVERILDRERCSLVEIAFAEMSPARTPGELERRRAEPESLR